MSKVEEIVKNEETAKEYSISVYFRRKGLLYHLFTLLVDMPRIEHIFETYGKKFLTKTQLELLENFESVNVTRSLHTLSITRVS